MALCARPVGFRGPTLDESGLTSGDEAPENQKVLVLDPEWSQSRRERRGEMHRRRDREVRGGHRGRAGRASSGCAWGRDGVESRGTAEAGPRIAPFPSPIESPCL